MVTLVIGYTAHMTFNSIDEIVRDTDENMISMSDYTIMLKPK
eukprot:SAG11_NODE_327_length_10699_cov_4.828272_7_plen_42_part_00